MKIKYILFFLVFCHITFIIGMEKNHQCSVKSQIVLGLSVEQKQYIPIYHTSHIGYRIGLKKEHITERFLDESAATTKNTLSQLFGEESSKISHIPFKGQIIHSGLIPIRGGSFGLPSAIAIKVTNNAKFNNCVFVSSGGIGTNGEFTSFGNPFLKLRCLSLLTQTKTSWFETITRWFPLNQKHKSFPVNHYNIFPYSMKKKVNLSIEYFNSKDTTFDKKKFYYPKNIIELEEILKNIEDNRELKNSDEENYEEYSFYVDSPEIGEKEEIYNFLLFLLNQPQAWDDVILSLFFENLNNYCQLCNEYNDQLLKAFYKKLIGSGNKKLIFTTLSNMIEIIGSSEYNLPIKKTYTMFIKTNFHNHDQSKQNQDLTFPVDEIEHIIEKFFSPHYQEYIKESLEIKYSEQKNKVNPFQECIFNLKTLSEFSENCKQLEKCCKKQKWEIDSSFFETFDINRKEPMNEKILIKNFKDFNSKNIEQIWNKEDSMGQSFQINFEKKINTLLLDNSILNIIIKEILSEENKLKHNLTLCMNFYNNNTICAILIIHTILTDKFILHSSIANKKLFLEWLSDFLYIKKEENNENDILLLINFFTFLCKTLNQSDEDQYFLFRIRCTLELLWKNDVFYFFYAYYMLTYIAKYPLWKIASNPQDSNDWYTYYAYSDKINIIFIILLIDIFNHPNSKDKNYSPHTMIARLLRTTPELFQKSIFNLLIERPEGYTLLEKILLIYESEDTSYHASKNTVENHNMITELQNIINKKPNHERESE